MAYGEDENVVDDSDAANSTATASAASSATASADKHSTQMQPAEPMPTETPSVKASVSQTGPIASPSAEVLLNSSAIPTTTSKAGESTLFPPSSSTRDSRTYTDMDPIAPSSTDSAFAGGADKLGFVSPAALIVAVAALLVL